MSRRDRDEADADDAFEDQQLQPVRRRQRLEPVSLFDVLPRMLVDTDLSDMMDMDSLNAFFHTHRDRSSVLHSTRRPPVTTAERRVALALPPLSEHQNTHNDRLIGRAMASSSPATVVGDYLRGRLDSHQSDIDREFLSGVVHGDTSPGHDCLRAVVLFYFDTMTRALSTGFDGKFNSNLSRAFAYERLWEDGLPSVFPGVDRRNSGFKRYDHYGTLAFRPTDLTVLDLAIAVWQLLADIYTHRHTLTDNILATGNVVYPRILASDDRDEVRGRFVEAEPSTGLAHYAILVKSAYLFSHPGSELDYNKHVGGYLEFFRHHPLPDVERPHGLVHRIHQYKVRESYKRLVQLRRDCVVINERVQDFIRFLVFRDMTRRMREAVASRAPQETVQSTMMVLELAFPPASPEVQSYHKIIAHNDTLRHALQVHWVETMRLLGDSEFVQSLVTKKVQRTGSGLGGGTKIEWAISFALDYVYGHTESLKRAIKQHEDAPSPTRYHEVLFYSTYWNSRSIQREDIGTTATIATLSHRMCSSFLSMYCKKARLFPLRARVTLHLSSSPNHRVMTARIGRDEQIVFRLESGWPCILLFHWNVPDGDGVHHTTQRYVECKLSGGAAADAVDRTKPYVMTVPIDCAAQPCYVHVFRVIDDPSGGVKAYAEVADDAISLLSSTADRFEIATRSKRSIEAVIRRLSAHSVTSGRIPSHPLQPSLNTTAWGDKLIRANQDVFRHLDIAPSQVFYYIDTVKGRVPLIAFAYSAYRDAHVASMHAKSSPREAAEIERFFVHLLTVSRGLRRMDLRRSLEEFDAETRGNVLSDMVTLPGRCQIYVEDSEAAGSAPHRRPTAVFDQWISLSYQPVFGWAAFDCEDQSHFILYLLYILQLHDGWKNADLKTLHVMLRSYVVSQAIATIRESSGQYVAHVMVVCTDSRYLDTMTTMPHRLFDVPDKWKMPLLVMDSTQHADAAWTRESMDRAIPYTVEVRKQMLSAWGARGADASSLPYRVMKARMTVAEMSDASRRRYGTVSQLLGVTREGVVYQMLLGQQQTVGVPVETLAVYDDRRVFVTTIMRGPLNDRTTQLSMSDCAKHIPVGYVPRAPSVDHGYTFAQLYPSASVLPIQLAAGAASATHYARAEWLTFCIRGIDYGQFADQIDRCVQDVMRANRRVVSHRSVRMNIDDRACMAVFVELLIQ